MDQGLATAGAAAVAAAVSLVTLGVTVVSARRGEAQAAHRDVLAPYLEQLSDDLHTVAAGLSIMRKRFAAGQDVREWQAKAKAAGLRIDVTRRKVRFFLPGLEEGLRELALASDHIATSLPMGREYSDRLGALYERLGERVTKAIQVSYRTGMPPRTWRRWRVSRAASEVVRVWEERPRRANLQ